MFWKFRILLYNSLSRFRTEQVDFNQSLVHIFCSRIEKRVDSTYSVNLVIRCKVTRRADFSYLFCFVFSKRYKCSFALVIQLFANNGQVFPFLMLLRTLSYILLHKVLQLNTCKKQRKNPPPPKKERNMKTLSYATERTINPEEGERSCRMTQADFMHH